MSTKSAEKLLIKPNTTVWWSDASCLSVIEPLPEGVRTVARPGEATTALVFANDTASARDVVTAHRDQLARPATFWVAYPKGNRTDINRDSLWPILAEFGMRPVGQVALDDGWSAMRFRALKDGEAAFTGGR
jgi:hypothetical protein